MTDSEVRTGSDRTSAVAARAAPHGRACAVDRGQRRAAQAQLRRRRPRRDAWELERAVRQPATRGPAPRPLPYLVLSLAAMGGAAWALDWAELVPGATDPVRGSGWWTNVDPVLLPGEDLHLTAYSASRMWLALGLLVLAAVLIGALDRAHRSQPALRAAAVRFGPAASWRSRPGGSCRSRSASPTRGPARPTPMCMLRYLVAFGILLTQFLLLRWPVAEPDLAGRPAPVRRGVDPAVAAQPDPVGAAVPLDLVHLPGHRGRGRTRRFRLVPHQRHGRLVPGGPRAPAASCSSSCWWSYRSSSTSACAGPRRRCRPPPRLTAGSRTRRSPAPRVS